MHDQKRRTVEKIRQQKSRSQKFARVFDVFKFPPPTRLQKKETWIDWLNIKNSEYGPYLLIIIIFLSTFSGPQRSRASKPN